MGFYDVNIAASSNSAALWSNVWQCETSIKLTLTLCDVGFSVLNLANLVNFDAVEEGPGGNNSFQYLEIGLQ